MIKSPYATQYTREQQAGKANPQRNPTNYMALQQPSRLAAWLRRSRKAIK